VIPRAHITAWRSTAPWQTNEQIEQDLVISRALIAIYSDEMIREQLAFRGGTALHKLYLSPAVRYSEDIDLVQIRPGPIGPLFDRLNEQLSFLGKPRRKQKDQNSVLIYRFDSEIPPVVPLRLKIEINCREHFAVYGIRQKAYRVENSWFSGEADLSTFALEELLGSKLRALYQRRKGRDLFDLWYALTKTDVNTEQILRSFYKFMESSETHVSRIDFENNLTAKIKDRSFQQDMEALIRPEIAYDKTAALEIIMAKLIAKLD